MGDRLDNQDIDHQVLIMTPKTSAQAPSQLYTWRLPKPTQQAKLAPLDMAAMQALFGAVSENSEFRAEAEVRG